MNTNRTLEHPYPVVSSSASSSAPTGHELSKTIRTAATAAIIGFSAVSTAHAAPATSTPASTVELSAYELPPRGYQCVPMIRGKYTGWHCEKRSAATRDKTVAKTP